ncbi:MAG TPA: hypothetical protein VFQ61_28905 [Polyangiaceae bacterium]|nr:hypothetical protein [Polyangiaceae bacterium]
MLLKRAQTLALWAALSACLPLGCSKRLDPSECDALLERYVALLAASDRPGTAEAEVLRLKQRTRERAQHDASFAQCPARISRAQFDCAMQAPNADRLEQCLL